MKPTHYNPPNPLPPQPPIRSRHGVVERDQQQLAEAREVEVRSREEDLGEAEGEELEDAVQRKRQVRHHVALLALEGAGLGKRRKNSKLGVQSLRMQEVLGF